ncbi:MAG TPA: MerR family transcriptional regulator [Acidimicrobiales bacterium]|nr:MerR family transcriptional regulator [Acidimicrobiales bacterium]
MTEPTHGRRLDDLARDAGVASTTVRLYQNKGLLPPPRLVGRTGYYDDHHLARLRLIHRLQEDGFSLSAIARVLETWQSGGGLDDLVGAEVQLDTLLHDRHAIVLTGEELLARFPAGALTPDLVQRAGAMGLVEVTDDGRFRVPDERFLDTGATLVRLGVPATVVLDEWERLRGATDDIAGRFIGLFEQHLLPEDWESRLATGKGAELTGDLAQLRQTALGVLSAALDASIARIGAERLAAVLDAAAAEG